MRRALLLTCVLLIPLGGARAQATCEKVDANGYPTFTDAYLHVNNVRARILNNGALFWAGDPYVYEVPRGGGEGAVFAAGLLVGGLVEGEVRTAATTYGPWEFWPGPLGAAGAPPADCAPYDRLWEITEGDVAQYEATGYVNPRLRDWPWRLGAPVVDGDGVPGNYNLAGGDRPELLGHQTLWWIMNDAAAEHGNTRTPPLHMEVQGMAFAAQSDDPAVDDATFYRYRLTYRGTAPLDSAYVGLFVDPDLGNFDDDYVGVDTTLGLSYVYNADDHDEGHYGVAPPAFGFDVLRGPPAPPDGRDDDRDGTVDEPGETISLSAFVAYYGGGGPAGDPGRGADYYAFLRGIWKNGTPITIGGLGYPFEGYPSTTDVPTRFMYPGDPVTGAYWSERNIDGEGTARAPADRSFILSAGPFSMQPGETVEVVFAGVWARGADHLDSVTQLRAASRRVQAAWDAGFRPGPADLPAPPAAPVALLAPGDGAQAQPTNAILSWEPDPAADQYVVTLGDLWDETPETHVVRGTTLATSLPIDRTYRWQVVACNVGGCSPPSEAQTFATGAGAIAHRLEGFEAFLTVANGAGPLVPATGAASEEWGFPVPETPGARQQVGPGVWLLHTETTNESQADYAYFHDRVAWRNNWSAIVPHDYELRFTERGSRASGYSGEAVFDVPFELWRTGIATPDDLSDDVRMLPYVYDVDDTASNPSDPPAFNLTVHHILNFGSADHPVSPGTDDPRTDRIYWYLPRDSTVGEAGYEAWVDAIEAAPDQDARLALRDSLGVPAFGRMVLVNVDAGPVAGPWSAYNQHLPETGSVFRIVTAKPDAPLLAAPTDRATVAHGAQTLRWYGPATRLQVARDPDFEYLVLDVPLVSATSYPVPAQALAGWPVHYWRVGTPLGWSAPWRFYTDRTDVATEDSDTLPTTLTIDGAHPNPFRERVVLRVGLPAAGPLAVRVYDVLGRRVAVLTDGARAAGWHTVAWDAPALASGLYFVEATTGDGARVVRSVTRVR